MENNELQKQTASNATPGKLMRRKLKEVISPYMHEHGFEDTGSFAFQRICRVGFLGSEELQHIDIRFSKYGELFGIRLFSGRSSRSRFSLNAYIWNNNRIRYFENKPDFYVLESNESSPSFVFKWRDRMNLPYITEDKVYDVVAGEALIYMEQKALPWFESLWQRTVRFLRRSAYFLFVFVFGSIVGIIGFYLGFNKLFEFLT